MVTVSVFSKSTGNPVKDAKVVIGWSGFTEGMSKTEYTDNDGNAHFDHQPANGKVYVNGKELKSGHLSGSIVVYA